MKILVIDAATGESFERDLTTEEIAEQETIALEQIQIEQSKVAARDSALAKLAALGLTEEEIAAL